MLSSNSWHFTHKIECYQCKYTLLGPNNRHLLPSLYMKDTEQHENNTAMPYGSIKQGSGAPVLLYYHLFVKLDPNCFLGLAHTQ